jgi:hypothetical protein
MMSAFFLALLTLMSSRPVAAQPARCRSAAEKYAELNRQLIVENKSDAQRYPEVRASVTEQVRQLVDQQVSELLNTGESPNTANIVARIRCLQQSLPQYRPNPEITNVPLAIAIGNGNPAVIVAYEIYRGGEGAPDTMPVFEAFSPEWNKWHPIASTGQDLTGSTFFVSSLKAGKTGEHWFLLYGKRFEYSRARLDMEIISFDGMCLKTVWARTGISGTAIAEVATDHIVLVGESLNERGRAQEFRERYDVSADGLKLVSRTITKSF